MNTTEALETDQDDLWEGYEEDYDEQDFMDIGPAPQPLAWFMSFKDAEKAWGSGSFPRGRQATNLITLKSIWDNYSNPKGMGRTESIIYHLEKVFPDVEAAHRKRPLGEFKELLTLSYEEIYDALCDRLDARHRNKENKWQSFMEVAYDHADYLIREYMDKSRILSRSQFYDAMALMIYSSAEGIYLEGEVSRQLERMVRESKLSKRFRYEEAEYTLEKEDVDGVIVDIQTGEVAVCISIKCKGALTERTVETYRTKKGKTKPDLYYGYASREDWKRDSLTVIEPNGKGMKQLLRDYLSR